MEELEALLMTRRSRFPNILSTVTVDESTSLRAGNKSVVPPPRRKFNDLLLKNSGQSVINTTNTTAYDANYRENVSHISRAPSSHKDNLNSAITTITASMALPIDTADPQLPINTAKSAGKRPAVGRRNANSASTSSANAPNPVNNESVASMASAFQQICSNGSDLAVAAKQGQQKVPPTLPSIRSLQLSNTPAGLSVQGKATANQNVSSKPLNIGRGNIVAGSVSSGNGSRLSPRPPIAPASSSSSKPVQAAPNSASTATTARSAPTSANLVRDGGNRQFVRRRSRAENETAAAAPSVSPSITANSVPQEPRNPQQYQSDLIRLRDALDENITRQLEREGTSSQRENNSSVAMRNFLQSQNRSTQQQNGDAALPIWLRREIDEGIERDLLALAQRESRAQHIAGATRPTRRPQIDIAVPTVAIASLDSTPAGCYYDEDDEILAKALQASMEEF